MADGAERPAGEGRPAGPSVVALTLHGISAALLPPGLRAAPAVLRYTLSQETLRWILDRIPPDRCRTAAGLEIVTAGDLVALTFDDGCRSDFEVVFPALVSRGLKATFFVTAAAVGREGYVTWEQLAAMSFAGMDIGSHGLEHRKLVTLTPGEARREIRESKAVLEERLGQAVACFAPVGGHFQPWMVDEARLAGYRVFASTVPGRTKLRPGALFLKRNFVQAQHGAAHIGRLLRGDGLTLFGSRVRYEALRSARRILGIDGYERLKRLLLPKAGPR